MAYINKLSSLRIEECGALTITDSNFIAGSSDRSYAIRVTNPDKSGIGSITVYYAARPLHERYANFKARLIEALAAKGGQ